MWILSFDSVCVCDKLNGLINNLWLFCWWRFQLLILKKKKKKKK